MTGALDRGVGERALEAVGAAIGRIQEQRGLSVDLLESDEAYLAVFDAPDVRANDVAVEFENGTLRVFADRFRDERDTFDLRFPGRGLALDGEISLPPEATVDPEAATATVTERGTLEVLLPKRSETD